MNYFRPVYPFLLGLGFILWSTTFLKLALLNSLGQLALFTVATWILAGLGV